MTREAVKSRYDVIDKIGESATFTVYKARDRTSGQLVVFKVVRAPYAGQLQFLERLHRCAQEMARLPHPNLVRLLSAGEEEGSHFVVSEFVPGTTLEARLAAEAPLPEPEVLRLAIEIAEGLAYLHLNRLAHGDLRAQHVLVSPRGEVRLADAAFGEVLLSANPPQDFLMRAVPAMAPEVCAGGGGSPEADLYALGALLYRMVTARAPFAASSPAQLARLHAEAAPSPPSQLNPGISRALEDLILRLLAKDPAERADSTTQLVRELRQLAGHTPVGPSAAAAPSRFIAPASRSEPINPTMGLLYALLVLGVMLITAAGFALYAWYPSTREVKVPDLVGKSTFDAKALLTPLGLMMRERSRQFNDQVPEDQILRTDPQAGDTVKEGREIAVDVSDGPNLSEVPDLTELTLTSAKKIIEGRGFQVGEVTRLYHESIPVGHVLGQSPKGGTQWKRNDRVDLSLSRGPDPNGAGATAPPVPPPSGPLADDAAVRQISLQVVIPQGPKRQELKIVVLDQRGTTTAYAGFHGPGDTVEQTVDLHGREARVRVYVAGELVESDRILPDGRVVKE